MVRMNRARGALVLVGLVLGGCSHAPRGSGGNADRIPATAEAQYFKVTSNYTLIRDLTPRPDPGVSPILRVFQDSPGFKVAQISVRNPGNVYCQRGMPIAVPNSAPVGAATKDVYVFAPPGDDSVYCYSWGQTRTPIAVDYMVPKSSVSLSELPPDQVPKLLAAVKDMEAGQYPPDTCAVIDAAGLMTKETLKLTLPPQKDLPSIVLEAGDLIEFRKVEGKVAVAANKLVSGAIGPDGVAVSAKAPAAKPKANPALLEPGSRARQVFCTVTPEGGKPEVVYRGGDPAAAVTGKVGKLLCGINAAKKGAEKLAGQFDLSIQHVKKETALPKLLAQKDKEEQRVAADRKANAEAIQVVGSATAEWVEANAKTLARFEANLARQQAQAKYEAEHGPELRLQRDRELQLTDKLFPPQVSAEFERGGFGFALVSRPYLAANGTTYVSYLLSDGHTFLESKTDGIPSLFLPEQPFRPVQEILSSDVWVQTSDPTSVPQNFIACANRLPDVVKAVRALGAPAVMSAVPNRHEIFKKVAEVTVTDRKDCSVWFGEKIFSSPDTERLVFARQPAYRFCYTKVPRTPDASDPHQFVAYVADRIEALYASPNGAVFKKQVNRDHPFFVGARVTNVKWESGANMEKENCVSAGTLFPPMQANGLIEGI